MTVCAVAPLVIRKLMSTGVDVGFDVDSWASWKKLAQPLRPGLLLQSISSPISSSTLL